MGFRVRSPHIHLFYLNDIDCMQTAAMAALVPLLIDSLIEERRLCHLCLEEFAAVERHACLSERHCTALKYIRCQSCLRNFVPIPSAD